MKLHLVLAAIAALVLAACESDGSYKTQYLLDDGSSYSVGPEIAAER